VRLVRRARRHFCNLLLPLPRNPTPVQHACSFDYVAHDRAVLAKANQKVVADKLEKV
jgi:hypothetical protein